MRDRAEFRGRSTASPSVVVDTARSPHARLRHVPVSAVRLEDDFWAPRRERNRTVTLRQQYAQCEETGRIDNFRRAAGTIDGEFQGRYFNDSDVYKWLEAAAWTLATDDDPQLARLVDGLIPIIAAAQRPDGYLNTYFARERADERWTNFDLHEMYCAGHLVQAAVAHVRATGSTALIDIASRFADHICETFGSIEQGKRLGTDGHPEIEMALVELYRATGQRRYLAQAQFFLDVRGHGLLGTPYGQFGSAYHQDHAPFRELDAMVGHAVRAVYLTAGATDIYTETGEPALGAALHRLWANMVERKTYVTGGIGARYEGEAFGADYELPNGRAYAETCAAIGSIMWNWRLLLTEGDARYADALETTLYNGVLSGLSLDGGEYFYQNPLADDGLHRRQPWFGTACCPPNIARLLASLPGYVASVTDDEVWLHLYATSTMALALADGRAVELRQRTRYPWDGDIEVEVCGDGEFALLLRIPAWAEVGSAITVNGQPFEAATPPGSYTEIRRDWQPGDVVCLRLPMAVRRIESHPSVLENTGRVALMRGPLLYCVEGADHPGVDPRDLALGAGEITSDARPDLLGGIVTLRAEGWLASPSHTWTSSLYQTAQTPSPATDGNPASIIAIPYYAWANREPGPMQVWLRTGP